LYATYIRIESRYRRYGDRAHPSAAPPFHVRRRPRRLASVAFAATTARVDDAGARARTLRDGCRFIQPPGHKRRDGVAGGQRRGNRRGGATETDKRTDALLAVTSFPLARQNGRTIDRATTDERVSPSQTSANNVRKQCPRRQNGRLERAGRLRTGHRRF